MKMMMAGVVGLVLSLPVWAVDASILNLVMNDAKVVIGLNMDRVTASGIGKSLMEKADLDKGEFGKFIEATGFDPRRDLREALVASKGEHEKQGSLVIGRGRFESGRIAALAGVHGGSSQTYKGVTILGKDGGGAAFLGTTIVVAGSVEDVKAAIDRLQAGAKLAPALAAKIQSASGSYDAWMFSLTPPTMLGGGSKGGAAGQAELLQAIESFSGGIRVAGENVELLAEANARSEKDAGALVDVFRFLVQMMAGNQPPDSPLAKMLDSMRTSVDGKTARFQFTAPGAEILKLMDLPKKAGVRPVTAAR
ncbi:MAG: hypothetical protein FJW20_05860 [Acidimicrobiia bacterium]|nr:hypothetical protein [Acidimicrobiia bacterium]